MATNTTPARRAARRRAGSEVSQWAKDLPDHFLLCRDLGHTWQPYRGWHDSKQREYVQVLRCGRCAAERERHLDYSGRRVSQSYDYAEDYLAPAGSGVLSSEGRADVRLASLLRLIDEDSAPPAPADGAPADLAAHRKRKAG